MRKVNLKGVLLIAVIAVGSYVVGQGLGYLVHGQESENIRVSGSASIKGEANFSGQIDQIETVSDSIKENCENWGLGFSGEGQPPTANASPEQLKPYDTYYIGDTSKKVIYLTFDAGFENGNTAVILDALKKHNAKATFFLVGNYIKTSPELVKRMVEEGHIVANHTYSHPDMSAISSQDAFQKELSKLEDLFETTTGKKMVKYYRPPQGKYSVENLKMAKAMGYKTIFWSLAYVDWYQDKQPTKEEAYKKLLGRIHPGAIVLLHSTSKTNGQILGELLGKWEEMGYSFGTIDELCK